MRTTCYNAVAFSITMFIDYSCATVDILSSNKSETPVSILATVGILIEEPENTVALLNEKVTFKCKSDQKRKLVWDFLGNDSTKEELGNGYFVNPKTCLSPYCQIDKHESGNYNLNIEARKETAKRYRCTEPGSFIQINASLTVIGTYQSVYGGKHSCHLSIFQTSIFQTIVAL